MLSSVFDFRIKSLLLDTFTRNELIFVDHCRFIYLDRCSHYADFGGGGMETRGGNK